MSNIYAGKSGSHSVPCTLRWCKRPSCRKAAADFCPVNHLTEPCPDEGYDEDPALDALANHEVMAGSDLRPVAGLPARSCNDPAHNAERARTAELLADMRHGTPCLVCGAPIYDLEGHDEDCVQAACERAAANEAATGVFADPRRLA